MQIFGELDKLANKQAWPTAGGLGGHSGLFHISKKETSQSYMSFKQIHF